MVDLEDWEKDGEDGGGMWGSGSIMGESMLIRHVIIHKIDKLQHSASTLRLNDVKLEPDIHVGKLVEQLLDIYQHGTGKSSGTFQQDELNYPFAGVLRQFLDDDTQFVMFTHHSMRRLKQTIDSQNFATGGYVLFVDYEDLVERQMLVVMLNEKVSFAIDDGLRVKEGLVLNLDQLHMAARIRVTRWLAGQEKRYLSFVKGRGGGDIAKYFREFLGCTDFSSSQEQTKALVQAVKDYGKEKGYTAEENRILRQKVYTYCEEQRTENRKIYLEDLSRRLNEDNPNDFLRFANNETRQLDSEFEPHREVLRGLKLVRLVTLDWRISFESSLLGNRIKYDERAQTLTISDIPDTFKAQLEPE
ncbi:MAG: nucleoid-associated protein [Magnetococcales bacterium]|nr:nucleoid-associated protein [Magnetococcales bacterium]